MMFKGAEFSAPYFANSNLKKFNITILDLADWNDYWAAKYMPFAIFSVGRAGKALNSPSDCYGYGLLLCFTTVLDTGSGWRNVQIYIEDNGSGGAKTGRVYIRSGNTDNGGWKVFTGTKINYVTSS